MKKTYIKPIVIIENFSLSTNIAGGCEVKTNTPSLETCGYPIRTGEIIFLSSMGTACTTTEDDEEYNGFCYHVPIETNNLFNS